MLFARSADENFKFLKVLGWLSTKLGKSCHLIETKAFRTIARDVIDDSLSKTKISENTLKNTCSLTNTNTL